MEPSLTIPGSTILVGVAHQLANILASANAVKSSSVTATSIVTDVEDIAKVIESHDILYSVVKEELKSRDLSRGSSKDTTRKILYSKSQVTANPTTGETVTSQRQTELGRVLNVYQDTIQRLLRITSIPGVSAEELAAFKRAHAFSAYTCRFLGCAWATVGFGNDELRCDHETKHTQRLRCTIPDCGYDMPFPSMKALKGHYNTYHTPIAGSKTVRTTVRQGACTFCINAEVLCNKIKPLCESFCYFSTHVC
jgi:hypothetical protein